MIETKSKFPQENPLWEMVKGKKKVSLQLIVQSNELRLSLNKKLE